ncbi:MAG: riboflavin synthase [Nitrospirae bacterium]|nr:riboflavin synthase [Nitrospirota bacterium]
MFTGITLSIGEVASMKRRHGVTELVVVDAVVSDTVQIGHSVSVNGVCLTVVKKEKDRMTFDVSDETRTGVGSFTSGMKVNLEPAMSAEGRFGGHFVTGHIDGTGTIESKHAAGGGVIVAIEAPPVIQKYIVRKGSIAVDGVSLTVADVRVGGFSVVIIPHTSGVTTLAAKNRGDSVNIETDIIGKYVEKFVAAYSGVTARSGAADSEKLLNKLREEGFTR